MRASAAVWWEEAAEQTEHQCLEQRRFYSTAPVFFSVWDSERLLLWQILITSLQSNMYMYVHMHIIKCYMWLNDKYRVFSHIYLQSFFSKTNLFFKNPSELFHCWLVPDHMWLLIEINIKKNPKQIQWFLDSVVWSETDFRGSLFFSIKLLK